MDSGQPPGQVKNLEARTLFPHPDNPGAGKTSFGAKLRLAAG